MRDESAIEVGAQQANVWGHRAANLGFDRVTAIHDGSETDHEHDQEQEQEREMKSAYELAMERLEKKAPSLALTDEQKQQIAEID
jgi:RPA family protein